MKVADYQEVIASGRAVIVDPSHQPPDAQEWAR